MKIFQISIPLGLLHCTSRNVNPQCVILNLKYITRKSKLQLIPLKNTHREKAPSNETPALTKSTNKDIWVVSASNQLFIRGS